jgi:periplasmic divalent cation tolerance protein
VRDKGCIVVLVTVPNAAEAERIADTLVNGRKAACVNVLPQVSSKFWWEGKVDSEEEALLVVKTRDTLLDEVISVVKQNHSYEVPEIIALPIVGGSQDYLDWLVAETEKR